ncbi:MAG: hypothetical protein HQM10_16650 [Candidatus Riflebacteria bacterium]|nr:hypothetical protein [Candidatus Riflebacteria bacterium]
MILGSVFSFLQIVHALFSLPPLLVFLYDLYGSIVVDSQTGKVTNYQDFGGGISAFTVSIFVGALLSVFASICNRNWGKRAALVSHFVVLFAFKTAIIWNIYFSGRADQRILTEYPLPFSIFLVDIVALVVGIIFYSNSSEKNVEPGLNCAE